MSMVRPVVGKLVSVSLVAVLAACAAPQSLEMSRSLTIFQPPQPMAISALSRQFRAETPYIVNFNFDSDALDAAAMAKLDIQAGWIIDHPNVKFRVYGHTDKVGDVVYNAELGLRRAQRVVAYLMSHGIGEERLEAMSSFGEDLPVVFTEAPERLNRRTLTDVIGYIETPAPREPVVDPEPLAMLGYDVAPETGDDVNDTLASDPVSEGPTTADPSNETPTATADGGNNGGQNPNAGRGNGDDGGDPGKSGGKNKGGDEIS